MVDVRTRQRIVGFDLLCERVSFDSIRRRLDALDVDEPYLRDEDFAATGQRIASLVALVQRQRPRKVLGRDDEVEAARIEQPLYGVTPACVRHFDQLAQRVRLSRALEPRLQQVEQRL